MATTVYTVEEVELLDGTTVTLRPLNIAGLRKFMGKVENFSAAKTEEEGLLILLDAAALCLKTIRPEFWDDKRKVEQTQEDGTKVEVVSPGASAEFDEVLDMETVYRVLKVCGGIELNNPELLRAATASLQELGQN